MPLFWFYLTLKINSPAHDLGTRVEMQNHAIPINALAGQLLDRMINSRDAKYGFGTMTCSIYDTSWLSMVPKKEHRKITWFFFFKCFFYLLDK